MFEQEAFILRDVRVHALQVAFISRGEQSLEGLLVLGELSLQRDEVLQLLHRGLCLVAHVIQLPALRLLDGGQLAVEEGVFALQSVQALVKGLRPLILGGN